MISDVKLLIDGEFIKSTAKEKLPVLNPADQKILARVPMCPGREINLAVAGAQKAQVVWRNTPVSERMRVMLKYQELLKKNTNSIAAILSEENGKTLEDAKGDVFRGIEVVEHACAIPTLLMGEIVEGVARGVDTYSIRQPLGVCAGVCPFNFPAMVPLWMFPLAVACGNAFVLKPSEQVPLTAIKLGELFLAAGAPPGILQIVHGGRKQVDMLLTHPDIKAISFVGSTAVAEHIYTLGSKNGKRVQALAGAKNHLVVMPDADKNQVINALAAASCGAAGQRCMAISVAIMVGEAKKWLPDIAATMQKLKPGVWHDKNADFGPIINKKSLARVETLIAEGKKAGAKCLLDGTKYRVRGFPRGNWLGATLFAKVKPKMSIYREEIFGPVLVTMEAAGLEEALAIVNADSRGNGTSIFTSSGSAAREYQNRVEAGQVGINLPIPVALPFFSFTGWKKSFFGDLHVYGKNGVHFYTRTKTVTARWLKADAQTTTNMTIRLK